MKSIFLIVILIGSLFIYSSIASTSLPLGVDYIGRFNENQQANWPATGIRFQFQAGAPTVSLKISYKNCNENCLFNIGIFLDCEKTNEKYTISATNLTINYSLSTSIHTIYDIAFLKVNEAHYSEAQGIMEIDHIQIEGGRILPTKLSTSSCTNQHKLYFIGDSLTAGYGDLGSLPCTFTANTEDATSAYAFLIAQSLHAEVHITPWSGKGVVRNYGDINQVSIDPMPTYYNRTLADVSVSNDNYWSPNKYQPDLITIMLGTNDYSTQPIPSDDQFINGYMTFITQIQHDYPLSKILILCAPTLPGMQTKDMNSIQCQNTQLVAEKTNINYFPIPDNVWDGGIGCDYHPNNITQMNMANAVLPIIKSLLE